MVHQKPTVDMNVLGVQCWQDVPSLRKRAGWVWAALLCLWFSVDFASEEAPWFPFVGTLAKSCSFPLAFSLFSSLFCSLFCHQFALGRLNSKSGLDLITKLDILIRFLNVTHRRVPSETFHQARTEKSCQHCAILN